MGNENHNLPLISVIIPCYNDGAYLTENIAKLKLQTEKSFEIIIIDDGSTDFKTIEILKSISNETDIQVLQKENGKMSSARNYGVKYAKGEFIAALDADDYFEPNFFKEALEIFAKQPRTGVVTSFIKLFGEEDGISKPRGGNAFNFLFSNQCPACAMVRKASWNEIGGYDESMKLGYEDWEFYIRLTKNNWDIHVIQSLFLNYRQTKKSTLKNQTHPNRKIIIKYILEKHKDWYIECLTTLIDQKEIIYTESRIAFSTIWKLFKNRLIKKYK